jgi:hypothetical protein
MGAGSSAAGSGVVVGLCLVLLTQQFGFLDLSSVGTSILYFLLFAVVFGIVFGLLGMWLGARYVRKHAGLNPWQSKAAEPPADTPSSPPK